jgi:hypothetical protein
MKKLVYNCQCGQPHNAVVKNFSGGMARTLITLCRRYQQTNTWVDAKQVGMSPGDLEKLVLWGFAQQQPPQGRKKKSGIWMPTQNGYNFANGQTFAMQAIIVENGAGVGYVDKSIGVQHIIKQEELTKLWNS